MTLKVITSTWVWNCAFYVFFLSKVVLIVWTFKMALFCWSQISWLPFYSLLESSSSNWQSFTVTQSEFWMHAKMKSHITPSHVFWSFSFLITWYRVGRTNAPPMECFPFVIRRLYIGLSVAVLEYVDGGWVFEGSCTPGGIRESTGRRYFSDVLAGLIYLHGLVWKFLSWNSENPATWCPLRCYYSYGKM